MAYPKYACLLTMDLGWNTQHTISVFFLHRNFPKIMGTSGYMQVTGRKEDDSLKFNQEAFHVSYFFSPTKNRNYCRAHIIFSIIKFLVDFFRWSDIQTSKPDIWVCWDSARLPFQSSDALLSYSMATHKKSLFQTACFHNRQWMAVVIITKKICHIHNLLAKQHFNGCHN